MSADWDADEWAARLKAKLDVAGNGYLRMPIEEDAAEPNASWPAQRANRTTFAAMTVGMVNQALGELPGMAGHPATAVLHDLLAALLDLGHGGQPALLQPTKGVGKGVETTARRFVRNHAVAFVALLERTGIKATPACREVAKMLADAGHRGLKGNRLSDETVKGWWNATRQRDFAVSDPRGAAFLNRFFQHLEGDARWPFSAESARRYIRELIAAPAMQSKVGEPITSPPSV